MYSPAGGVIYLDGAPAQNAPWSSTPSATAATNELLIGAYARGAQAPTCYSGLIDDVRIYNRALSSAEVQSLYNFEKVVSDATPLAAVGVTDFPSQAFAMAQVVNGFVVGVAVVNGGNLYTNVPSVTIFGGGGVGAQASASVSNGVVTEITIVNPGSGYSSNSWVEISEPAFPPTQAAATASLTNGSLSGLTIANTGYGYPAPPVVLIFGGGGTGATATASVNNGVLTGFTITNPGTGYTNPPSVLVASPPAAPSLSIRVSQVTVTMQLSLGYTYQLQNSPDLSAWSDVGSPFVATNQTVAASFDTSQFSTYFRVLQVAP